MVQYIKAAVISFSALAVIVPLSIAAFMYRGQYCQTRQLNTQLNEVLNQTILDKEELQARNADIAARLDSLKDAENTRNSLIASQKLIIELNGRLAELDSERMRLSSANASLSTRLDGATKELTKTLEELRSSRADSQINSLKKKIDDLTRSVGLKESTEATLRGELASLQKANRDLIGENEQAGKRIRALQEEPKPSQDISRLEQQIAALKNELDAKQQRLSELDRERASLIEKLSRQKTGPDREQLVEELTIEAKEYQKRIARLEKELQNSVDSPRKETENAGIASLYDKAKDQIHELSQLLVKKENQVEDAKRESFEAREKMIGLESQIAKLEARLSEQTAAAGKVRALEEEKMALSAKFRDLEASLAKKSELAESLQQNVIYLNEQLARTEGQMRDVQGKYSRTEEETREEIEKQKASFTEMNVLYTSLKAQLSQFSEALSQKETELARRREEIAAFKDELAKAATRSDRLEQELVEARQRQKETLDELVSAVKLNSVLQQRSAGMDTATPAYSTEEQRKATDLKRRIEIILEPEKK